MSEPQPIAPIVSEVLDTILARARHQQRHMPPRQRTDQERQEAALIALYGEEQAQEAERQLGGGFDAFVEKRVAQHDAKSLPRVLEAFK